MSALRRRGFSLLELSVSLVAASILVVGMGTSIYLASQAANAGVGRHQNARQAGEALSNLARELSFAVSVNNTYTTTQRVECTVPDLTGDGLDDVVRYSWAGTAGSPLLRTLNAGTAQTVADNVQHLQLSLQKRAKSGGSATESAQRSWMNDLTSGSTQTFSVDSSNSVGQYFLPTLPAGATAWRITRIDVKARRSGTTDGILRVQVRQATTGYAPSTLLEEVSISESRLPSSMGTYSITVPGAASLSPGQPACLLFLQEAGSGTAAVLEYGSSSSATTNTRKLQTWFTVFWFSQATEDLHLAVWGTYTGPPGTGTQEFYYTNIDASLQLGSQTATRLHAGIPLINTPAAP